MKYTYLEIHLHPAIVKEDNVSRKSRIDLFRYGWIHLQSAIVREYSVSRQSSIDLFRISDMVGFAYPLQ